MKRNSKIFAVLLVGLFLLAMGLNQALDHFSRAATQNSFTIYSEQGTVLLTYNGDLNECKALGKPEIVLVPRFLHRT